MHIEEIKRQDAVTFAVLWADIGVALMDRGLYERALDIFTQLTAVADVNGVSGTHIMKASLRAMSFRCFPMTTYANWKSEQFS